MQVFLNHSFIRNVLLQETQPHILPPVNAIPAAPVNDAILELANLSSDALAEKVVSSVLDAGESSGGEGSRSDSNDPIDQISRWVSRKTPNLDKQMDLHSSQI